MKMNKEDIKNKMNDLTDKTIVGIKNLKVNNEKMYELAKADTKLIFNTFEHVLIVAGIMNLIISVNSPILGILGGFVVVKTLLHTKKSNDEIISIKRLYKYHK